MVSVPPDLAMASPLTNTMTEGLSQLTSSSLGTTTTETLRPTTLNTTNSTMSTDDDAIITTAVTIVMSFILIIVVISLVVVCFKRIRRRNQANAAVHTVMMTNEAYGVVLQDMTTSGEDSAYSYPSVDPASSIEGRQNEAYATNVAAQRNVAYRAATVTTGESHEFGMYDYL